MNPLKRLCLMACLVAVVCASPTQKNNGNRGNAGNNSLKPTDWLSPSELQSIPSLDEVSLQRLENMSAEKGAKLVDALSHLAQINHDLTPTFTPSPSNIPAYIIKPNGQNVTTNLNNLAATAKQQPNFGDEEVTVFITGLPQQSQPVRKATKKLVKAYVQRYNRQQQQQQQSQNTNADYYEQSNNDRSSSEENENQPWKSQKQTTGNLIVIDLGSTLTSFKRIAMLDIDQTGKMIGKVLVELADEVPHDIIHVVAQGVASHVAGAAGRQFIRETGHQLRRITALDPSKILAKNPNTLSCLARGDAEFVDAIHTSAYGMGTPARVGDIDFYPNGPSESVPGAENVVEATMRATRYFAESVRPGNERNFPAVAARSLEQYKNNNGYGKRAYMGIDTDYDSEGDYILQVNAQSPYGRNAPAQKQSPYHGVHQGRKNSNSQDYE